MKKKNNKKQIKRKESRPAYGVYPARKIDETYLSKRWHFEN